MKHHIKKLLAACAGVAIIVSSPSVASAASTEAAADKDLEIVQLGPFMVDQSVDTEYGEVPEHLKEDVASSLPKTITVDAFTGDVTSVVFDEDTVTPFATPTINSCPTSVPCWYGMYGADANIGFSGTGSAYGTWTGRGDFQTRSRAAQQCWLRPAAPTLPTTEVCGALQNPYTRAIFTERVTGTRVSIF